MIISKGNVKSKCNLAWLLNSHIDVPCTHPKLLKAENEESKERCTCKYFELSFTLTTFIVIVQLVPKYLQRDYCFHQLSVLVFDVLFLVMMSFDLSSSIF